MSRSDDELIFHLYGEHDDARKLTRELAADPELALRFERLRRDLAALDALTPPEPRPGLEARMWARVEPELAPAQRRGWRAIGWPRFAALASAVAIIAAAAFLAGRLAHTPQSESEVVAGLKGLPPEARERVLAAALVDHLDASQRLLLEVRNGRPSLDDERAAAGTLLGANRLYRRAAERSGERRVAAVLTDLEGVLTELANASSASDPQRLLAKGESDDLLFKVRIARNNLKRSS